MTIQEGKGVEDGVHYVNEAGVGLDDPSYAKLNGSHRHRALGPAVCACVLLASVIQLR